MIFKLKKLEEELGEIIQEIVENQDVVLIDEDEDYQLWREESCIYILDLGVDVYSAISCLYNEDTRDYEVNSSLFVFYNHGTTEEVYTEFGSSFPVCVYNYIHFLMKKELHEMSIVENLDCVFLLKGKEVWNNKQYEHFNVDRK